MNLVDEKTTTIIGQWCNSSTSTYLSFKRYRTSKNVLKNQDCKSPTTVDELIETLRVRQTCEPMIFCIVKYLRFTCHLQAVVTSCMTNHTISAAKTKPLIVVVSTKDSQRIKRVFKAVKPSKKLFFSNKIYYKETIQMTHVFCNH